MKQNNNLLPAVFVHIQKTAGSSIVELARAHYKKSLVSHGDYDGQKPEELQDIGFISGHFGYEFARPLMSDRYSFTFLRNPVDRVLSFYYFCKRMNPNELEIYHLAQKLKLEEFLELSLKKNRLKTAVCNNQAWQLAYGYGHGTKRNYHSFGEQEMQDMAISHLDKFSHIGFTETFNEDRNIIFNKLGLPLPKKDVILNKSTDRPSVHDLPESIVSLLRKVTCIDQVIYDHAWSCRHSY